MKAGDKEWFNRLLVEMNDRQAAVGIVVLCLRSVRYAGVSSNSLT